MKNLSTIRIFQGYREIVEDFWGIEALDHEPKLCGDWWEKYKVIMSDEVDVSVLEKIGYAYENEVAIVVYIGGKGFEVFSLYGDGGFYSLLFKAKDFYAIMEKKSSLEFIQKS